MWYRTEYKDGNHTIEQRYVPAKGSLVVSSVPFLTEGEANANKSIRPLTKGLRSCYFCKYYHRSASFCAVNPSLVGKGNNCIDREERKYVRY